jgi:two-component system sensor histidine kinase QseC
MQKITTCLTFNNRAEEALDFYAKMLKGSSVTFRNYTGSGENKQFLVGGLEYNGYVLNLLNGGNGFEFTMGFSLMIHCETQEDIDYYWQQLVEGGGEHSKCGWLTDRFGVSWQVAPANFNKYFNNEDPAKSQRAFNAMLKMDKIIIADMENA